MGRRLSRTITFHNKGPDHLILENYLIKNALTGSGCSGTVRAEIPPNGSKNIKLSDFEEIWRAMRMTQQIHFKRRDESGDYEMLARLPLEELQKIMGMEVYLEMGDGDILLIRPEMRAEITTVQPITCFSELVADNALCFCFRAGAAPAAEDATLLCSLL